MGNPLFNLLGGGMPQGNGSMQILKQFQEFRKQMQGKNPQEEINQLLQSGKISQQQLNQAQQMAGQMRGLFEGLKK
ncbi:hypothetical protein [Blautia caecimuris]|uniref:hypothetical protein n=1 Tax=Blautia caecimuris TaxID=1796615 RepID=UPI0039961FCC